MVYTSSDQGTARKRDQIYRGHGTFQATAHEIDSDGEVEIIGQPGVAGDGINIWTRCETPSFPIRYRHRFVPRQRPSVTTNILAVDLDGDGRQDMACSGFWYKNPTRERVEIPGIHQVINACDVDGDGRLELIATKPADREPAPRSEVEPDLPGGYLSRFGSGYGKLTGELYLLNPVDPLNGEWEDCSIGQSAAGKGSHGWPHGTCIGPVLLGGRVALISRRPGPLEIYEAPDDPRKPWPKREFTEAAGGASAMTPHDMTGDGKLDLVAEWIWLESLGDGTFRPHEIIQRFDKAGSPDGFRGV
jgi:hypothetical protein